MISGIWKCVFVGAAMTVAACTGATNSSAPTAAAQADAAGQYHREFLVTNTIVRVGGLKKANAIRAEIEEIGAGLHWSKGTRPAEALVLIGEVDEQQEVLNQDADQLGDRENASVNLVTLGNKLIGSVSLVDPATGEVLVGPINITASVPATNDLFIGIAEGTKGAVNRKYLAEKFVLQARTILYGPGV